MNGLLLVPRKRERRIYYVLISGRLWKILPFWYSLEYTKTDTYAMTYDDFCKRAL
jgi:hypothetical protein